MASHLVALAIMCVHLIAARSIGDRRRFASNSEIFGADAQLGICRRRDKEISHRRQKKKS